MCFAWRTAEKKKHNATNQIFISTVSLFHFIKTPFHPNEFQLKFNLLNFEKKVAPTVLPKTSANKKIKHMFILPVIVQLVKSVGINLIPEMDSHFLCHFKWLSLNFSLESFFCAMEWCCWSWFDCGFLGFAFQSSKLNNFSEIESYWKIYGFASHRPSFFCRLKKKMPNQHRPITFILVETVNIWHNIGRNVSFKLHWSILFIQWIECNTTQYKIPSCWNHSDTFVVYALAQNIDCNHFVLPTKNCTLL